MKCNHPCPRVPPYIKVVPCGQQLPRRWLAPLRMPSPPADTTASKKINGAANMMEMHPNINSGQYFVQPHCSLRLSISS